MSQIAINRTNRLKDFASVAFFVASVVCGTLLINAFVFRSYSIVGASMEQTLSENDRVVVNRLPITWSQIKNEHYVPSRGSIIVFVNPHLVSPKQDRYLIKRVVGLPGDVISIHDNNITIVNDDHPDGFDPNELLGEQMNSFVSGEIKNVLVQDNHLFVIGDHRNDNNSYDSRNGLGQIPFHNVVGPVSVRLFPIKDFRFF